MTIQELRVEALRAAVQLEVNSHKPDMLNAIAFAEGIYEWLAQGKSLTRPNEARTPLEERPPPHAPADRPRT